MVDDIYEALFFFENPSGASSTSLYYKQTADNLSSDDDPALLALALAPGVATAMALCVSAEWNVPSVRVRQVYSDADTPRPPYTENLSNPIGRRAGDALPANIAINLGLVQSGLANNRNGRIFLPGVAEPDQSEGVLLVSYTDGPLQALATTIIDPVAAISDSGVWQAGVISDKVLNAAPPLKDWAAAWHPVVNVTKSPLLSMQRRRTTKVRGAAI